jgi:hypothetical protein
MISNERSTLTREQVAEARASCVGPNAHVNVNHSPLPSAVRTRKNPIWSREFSGASDRRSDVLDFATCSAGDNTPENLSETATVDVSECGTKFSIDQLFGK